MDKVGVTNHLLRLDFVPEVSDSVEGLLFVGVCTVIVELSINRNLLAMQ